MPEDRGARESSEGAGVAYMLRSRCPPPKKRAPDWAVVRAQMDDAYLLGPADVLDEVEGSGGEKVRGTTSEVGWRLIV